MNRKTVKKTVNGFCTLAISPLLCLYGIVNIFFPGDRFFWSMSQFLSLLPGVTGSYLRKNFYARTMTRCSREGVILFGTIFSHRDTEIGDRVYIGPQCNIGTCRIEDDCTIGSGVHILSGKSQHGYDDLDTPIQQQAGVYKKINIGQDTWVGNGAIVLADIGKKCIIGAGAVVTKDVEDYAIVAGNPGKVIRKRIPS